MTEDDAGSDVGRLATTARRDGDVYVLDGTKSFVSNAPLADILLVYASTDPSAGYFGTTAFVVPTALAGMTIGRPLAKLGLRGGTAARVTFAGCRVPAGQRLGDEGAGRVIFQHSMDWERSCLFGIYLGMLDRQLESCVGHVRTRRQFGRRLSDFQAISHQLVQMRQRIEGARLLLYRAAWTLDRNDPDQAAIAMAKISVSEAAVANSTDAVQVFGAIGCLESSEAADQIRDSIPSRIFSGTNEIQRELIARDMGL
jgi:clorobiocin biosynthesis protein CloN3